MNDKLKTIFIPIYHAWESRNVLRTDVFLELKKRPDLKIILLVPEGKISYYQENFSALLVFQSSVDRSSPA